MNNVTHSNNNELNLQVEGAGTWIALCCCTLFFLFQVLTYFPATSPSPSSLSLKISDDGGLHLLETALGSQNTVPSEFLSPEHHRLTPFFFQPIPINSCDIELLMTIKGIGPSLARRIISTRNRIGPFLTPEDLLQVNGVGPVRLQQFSSHLRFGSYSATR